MSDAQKAKELVDKAEGIMKKWVYLGDKWEDSLNMLDKAANLYKMGKLCTLIIINTIHSTRLCVTDTIKNRGRSRTNIRENSTMPHQAGQ